MKRENLSRVILIALAIMTGVEGTWLFGTEAAGQTSQARARDLPMFEVDPSWPKVPAKWKLGDVSSIAIDAQGQHEKLWWNELRCVGNQPAKGAVGPKKAGGRTILHSTLCKQDIQDKSAGFLPSGHPGRTPRVSRTREDHSPELSIVRRTG